MADVVLTRDGDTPSPPERGRGQGRGGTGSKWSLAIHGGAGTMPKNIPEAEKEAYLKSLREALDVGRKVLAGGGTSLDAVEKVVRTLEDNPLFNAGKGAVFTHDGTNELDSAIM